MAEFVSTFPSGSGRLRLIVNEASSNAGSNTSLVAWQLTLEGISYAWRGYNDCPWSLSINGITVASATNANYTLNAGTVQVLHEGTMTVAHGADGNKSVWCEARYDGKSPLGSTAPSGSLTLTRTIIAPPAATGLTVTRVTPTRIDVAWTNPSSARGPYAASRLERWNDATNAWTLARDFAGNSYSDTSVQATRAYRFRVTNRNAAGSAATVTSARVVGQPAAATGVTATRDSDTQITIKWTNPSSTNFPYSQTRLERWDNISNAWTLIHVDAMSSYTNSGGLVADRAYQYRLTQVNGVLSSASVLSPMVYAKPLEATGLTATRVSDAQINLSWTNPTSTYRPYGWTIIERYDNVSGRWAGLKTITGTSYSDTAVQADRAYQYRVRQRNTSGASGYVTSGTVYTSPAAPINVSAARSGTDAVVTWTDRSSIEGRFGIQDNPDGTGWVLVGTAVGANLGSWTHTNPNAAQTHQYRVQAVVTGIIGGPWSAASNIVQLITAPNAPTLLAPVGGVALDVAKPITLSWRHNPIDTTAQTGWGIQYREQGTTTWTQLSGSTQTSHTIAASALTTGKTYEWQARTKGQHADWSPWSTSQTFRTSAIPTVAIVTPEAGQVWASNRMTYEWAYGDPEGTAQSHAWLTLRTDGTIHWQADLSGPATSYEHPTFRFANATDYVIDVQVRDGDGLLSAVTSRTFRVEFREPAQPSITATWLGDDGAALLEVTNPEPTPEQETTARNEVWASLDPDAIALHRQVEAADPDGPGYALLVAQRDAAFTATATPITTDLPAGGAMTDPIPGLDATLYRVLAVSPLDTSQWSEIVRLDGERCAYWLNAGPGLSLIFRWAWNPMAGQQFARAKTLHAFSGRPNPVEYVGHNRHHTYSLGGLVDPTEPHSLPADLIAVIDAGQPIFLRDPLGNRHWVSISNAQWDADTWSAPTARGPEWDFSASATVIGGPDE